VSLRLLQIVLPSSGLNRLEHILDEAAPPSRWRTDLDNDLILTSVLLRTEVVEPVCDAVHDEFKLAEGFRMVLLPVEATHPTLPAAEPEPEAKDAEKPRWHPRFGRISREELIEDIESSSRTTAIFLIMVALASVVAGDDLSSPTQAIIIGAMVIAPLLGPNISLALGTTLGDFSMVRRAIRSNLVGVSIAVAIALVFGMFFLPPGQLNEEMAIRTRVDLGDVLLALCSGAAGAIAFTSGASATVVGVMVAVALLPPTVVCAMLLGARQWLPAGESATLAATNIVCINLAAAAVFMVQGVRPSAWWEKDTARVAAIRAMIMWTAALTALAVLIFFAWR